MNILLYDQKATNPQLKRLSWLKKNKKPKTCDLDKAKSAISLSLYSLDKLKNWQDQIQTRETRQGRKLIKDWMRKYRDGHGAEQRQFKKGYTKKTSNPRTTLRTALVHYVRLGRNKTTQRQGTLESLLYFKQCIYTSRFLYFFA